MRMAYAFFCAAVYGFDIDCIVAIFLENENIALCEIE